MSNNITPGMSETQNAIDFIDKKVLTKHEEPLVGSGLTMIDQSVGMMVQDLQMFLKGFEQIGLVALAKLANNYLTTGSISAPTKGSNGSNLKSQAPTSLASTESEGKEVIHSLFKMVAEYGEAKSKINALIRNPEGSRPIDKIYAKPAPTSSPQEAATEDTTTSSKASDIITEQQPIEDEKPKTKEKTFWFKKGKKE